MKYYHDTTYLDLMRDVLENGTTKGDRTGTGTTSVFSREMRFNLADGSIPLLTTKKMHIPSIIHEIIWYLSGDTNVKYLNDNGVRIWNEWADENGELGPVYGAQWRKWKKFEAASVDWNHEPSAIAQVKFTEIDQIANIIDQIKNNPNDRRIIVSAWNVGDLDEMNLPPCHAFFQFWTRELSVEERQTWFDQNVDRADYDCPISDEAKHEYFSRPQHGVPKLALSCKLTQRSCDTFLGVPFNIVQYSILTHMIAQVTGTVADEFIWSGGDIHIYSNHMEQCREQLERKPYPSPTLKLNPEINDIDDFTFEDFEIVDYESHPTIKAKVSI